MKYLYYVFIVLFTVFRKVFGLVWYWVVFPLRAKARSVVYNWHLQNNIPIVRLWERKPTRDADGWVLNDVHHVGRTGYVRYAPVGKIEYVLWFWLVWGWLDDDSNEDTFDKGHNDSYIDGKRRFFVFNDYVVGKLKMDNERATVYGNAFDLGDLRAENPHGGFFSQLIWNTRNVAYNFAYALESTTDESKVFYFEIGGFQFGWVKDWLGNYKIVFGKDF